MSGPRRLGEVLKGWTPQPGAHRVTLTTDVAVAVFASAWEQAVGARVARRSHPTKFRDGVLTVLTASSTWSDELSLHAPQIIAALRRAVPSQPLHRLRFMVASGRSRLLLDGVGSKTSPAQTPVPPERASVPPPHEAAGSGPEDVASGVARLAALQATLDADRDRAGWKVCISCGRRVAPEMGSQPECALCADEKRRREQAAIELLLMRAPWLSLADVRRVRPGTSGPPYERARQHLLARWQSDLDAAQRRLRRGAATSHDRVVAWSYLMLATGMAQHDIGRAVVESMLGREWTSVLFAEVGAPNQEARRLSREKQKRETI